MTGKILSSRWMYDMKKWFRKCSVLHLLRNATKDSFVDQAFLQCQCNPTWEKYGFTSYITYIGKTTKPSFLLDEQIATTHTYWQSVSLYPPSTLLLPYIVVVTFSSRRGKTSGHLQVGPNHVYESIMLNMNSPHTITCESAFYVVITNPSPYTFLSQSHCALSIFISKILEH